MFPVKRIGDRQKYKISTVRYPRLTHCKNGMVFGHKVDFGGRSNVKVEPREVNYSLI